MSMLECSAPRWKQSGLKADPQRVSNDMHNTRDEQNRRLFE